MEFYDVFTDEVYSDEADDFGPFGSDEGADLWAEWEESADELASVTTLEAFVDTVFPPQDGIVPAREQFATLHGWATEGLGEEEAEVVLEDAWTVLQCGFVLLRATMRLDAAGRDAMLDALTLIEQIEGPEAEFATMRRDLAAWSPTQA